MTYLRSALFGAAAVAALTAYSVHRSQSSHSALPPVPTVAQGETKSEESFDEDWRDATVKIAVARPMFVELPRAEDQPVPDRGEKIVLPAIITHGIEGPPQTYSRKKDLCERHGMRKVHYGRTWRCRPKKR